MVDHRARAWPPGRVGVTLEVLGGLVAEEFHAVAAFDQCHALGDEAFQFHRADLGAVLLLLTAPLRLLIVVEFTGDPVDGTVEEIDGRPEQILKVVTRSTVRWKRLTVDQSRSSRSGSRRVSVSATTRASKMSETAPATAAASGRGLGSGSSWKGR